MDIHSILTNYDAMFGKYPLSEIEAYLYENIEKAKAQSETGILFTILNEMIGFCRDTTQKEKALKYCKELLELLGAMKLEGSMEYATSLLNIANAYRAFGLLKTSLELFEQVEQIYKQNLDAKDFGYANLYNNWGLAYQEVEDYKKVGWYTFEEFAFKWLENEYNSYKSSGDYISALKDVSDLEDIFWGTEYEYPVMKMKS